MESEEQSNLGLLELLHQHPNCTFFLQIWISAYKDMQQKDVHPFVNKENNTFFLTKPKLLPFS